MIYEKFYNFKNIDIPNPKTSKFITNEILHVILVVYSPFGQNHRCKLAQECIQRMESFENVSLHVVELIYPNQDFMLILKNKKNHLKLKLQDNLYIWSKENLINIAVRQLLPSNWKYMAWIDADIEFENKNWDNNVLSYFISYNYDVLQLFSVCKFLNAKDFIHLKKGVISNNGKGSNGYAWACTRKLYDRIGGLFEYSIIGGGDSIFLKCLYSNINELLFDNLHKYNECLIQYYNKFYDIKYGFVPLVIIHHYHGDIVNRCYNSRYQILIKNNYDPNIHIMKENNLGLLLFNKEEYEEFHQEIVDYFKIRKEIE